MLLLSSVSIVTLFGENSKKASLRRLQGMSLGCEVGMRKNTDRGTVLRYIPPNPHTIPQPDRQRDRQCGGSTYASGDALPSRGKPSRGCMSIKGWQRGGTYTRDQG